MLIKDAFRFIIKAFGIYCFIDALFTLIPNLSYSNEMLSISLKINAIYFIVIILITYILLFQTERIINLFKLDTGFETDQIKTNVKSNDLYGLAIIAIGLLLVVNNLGSFINYCYLAFKREVSSTGLAEIEGAMHDQFIDYNWWVISGLNVLIGILMITNYKKLTTLLVK